VNDGFDFNNFSAEVERTAATLMGSAPTNEEFIQTGRAVQEMAESALARHRTDDSLIACGPGCAHCCVVNVAVLHPESAAIVDYLERKLSPGELLALRRKVDEQAAVFRWLDDEERVNLQQPCALLDEAGSCRVYPVRPLLCRGVTSINPETCRQAIDLHPLGDAPPVTVNLFQSFLFNQAFIALARAMEGIGLDSRSMEMTAAIKTLLDDRHG